MYFSFLHNFNMSTQSKINTGIHVAYGIFMIIIQIHYLSKKIKYVCHINIFFLSIEVKIIYNF